MAYAVVTALHSIQLIPETTAGGLEVFRAIITVRNDVGPIAEEVTLSVVVKAGNRNLSEITYEAMGRAATIIAGLNATPRRSPSAALSDWAQAAEDQ